MLETQIKLDEKITEIKNYYTKIRQLKLKLSAVLTEKHLQTSSLNSFTDFITEFFYRLLLSLSLNSVPVRKDSKF